MEILLVAVVVAGGGLAWRWSRRQPGVPLKWQTSQSVAADLHRRMHRSVDRTRQTVTEARKRGVPTSGYEGLCDRLVATARAIDDQLVLASQLPYKSRHKVLLGLRYRIADVERTGDRIGRTALEAASPLVGSIDEALDDINERLDHHAEAIEELKELGGA
ncbi:MAG: hypothetical protein WD598_11420 [Acidimicrobiia bacterium]